MDKFPRIGLIFLLLATRAGCGAKGPLFLPEKPASQEIPEDEAEAPADEADSALLMSRVRRRWSALT